jgi:Transposase DDE domain group 1
LPRRPRSEPSRCHRRPRAWRCREQVIADVAGSALAHLPSGSFNANAAWALLWAIAHNLTRAAGTLASMFHARATTATIRAHLINVPARIARGARRVTLHLPDDWPWHAAWKGLYAAVHRQPLATA